MGAILEGTTAAKASNPFVVLRGQTVSVTCWGLAGAETAVIQKLRSNHTWADLTDTSATMSATEPDTSILASGTYRVNKDATAGLSGVDID